VTYAHVFDWPKDRKLRLTGMNESPREAYLLADHQALVIAPSDSGFVVTLPRNAPSAIASVVVLVGPPQAVR
jgi:alpha-L-fucosidase